MNNVRAGHRHSYLLIIVLILAISLAFGFLFDTICTAIERAIYTKPDKYQGFVASYSVEYGVPENLIYAVIKIESGFDQSAVSDAGAIGLMQMVPDTFLWLTNDRLKDRYSEGMLYDPNTNIKYGVYYLSTLYTKYGSWDTALAAYNAGPGNVDDWLSDPKYNANGDSALDEIPYKETRNYIKKVNRARSMYDKLY